MKEIDFTLYDRGKMALEKSQLKFAKSEETGEMIGFVSRHSKTKKLKGVREDSTFGKKICVLSQELKGTIIPNVLYNVELKSMHKGNGYVVSSARPVQFKAQVEMVIVPKQIYQVNITFGNKTIYFDPKEGKSNSSRTIDGVLDLINTRNDIDDRNTVIKSFKEKATLLIDHMKVDGYFSDNNNKNETAN